MTSPRSKPLLWVGILAAIAAVAWWLLRPSAESTTESAASADEELRQWGVLEPPRRTRGPRSAAPRTQPPSAPGATDEERRRQRWQERWRRAVDIVPLGPADPGIDPGQLREALAAGRPALRECIRESGGWRALRAARRAEREAAPQEEGATGIAGTGEGRRRRPRRRVSFDVRPGGDVDPESIAFSPPIPEAFQACFDAYIASAHFATVGEDGARVEMPMGPPGRRQGRGDGDGGVPRPRWRGGGGEFPREEGRSRRDRGRAEPREWRNPR